MEGKDLRCVRLRCRRFDGDACIPKKHIIALQYGPDSIHNPRKPRQVVNDVKYQVSLVVEYGTTKMEYNTTKA